MLKKLNNKGYLLVEIIVSFVIAMGVAYFLAEITLNLKDRQEDLDKEVGYNFDKSIITKEIMDDVNKYGIKKISNPENVIHFELKNGKTKDLIIEKNGTTTIIKYDSFERNLDDTLTVGELKIENKNNKILLIKLPATSIYSKKDYGLNLVIPADIVEVN